MGIDNINRVNVKSNIKIVATNCVIFDALLLRNNKNYLYNHSFISNYVIIINSRIMAYMSEGL